MSRPLPTRLSRPKHTARKNRNKQAADLESIAHLVEDVIPTFKKEEEQQFYREVMQSCRTAAENIRQSSLQERPAQIKQEAWEKPESMKGKALRRPQF